MVAFLGILLSLLFKMENGICKIPYFSKTQMTSS